jgi:hypothetical protein
MSAREVGMGAVCPWQTRGFFVAQNDGWILDYQLLNSGMARFRHGAPSVADEVRKIFPHPPRAVFVHFCRCESP